MKKEYFMLGYSVVFAVLGSIVSGIYARAGMYGDAVFAILCAAGNSWCGLRWHRKIIAGQRYVDYCKKLRDRVVVHLIALHTLSELSEAEKVAVGGRIRDWFADVSYSLLCRYHKICPPSILIQEADKNTELLGKIKL